MKIYYVYRITNLLLNKHYYGKRTTIVDPLKDLGIKYFSSSKDKSFITDQKLNPNNYKYKVVRICKTSREAVLLEILLHHKFNVGISKSFYNRCKQTSIGFDTTGIPYTEERKKVCSSNSLGRRHTIESKAKISIANKGNQWNKGRKHTTEAITKMKTHCKKGIAHHSSKLVDIYSYTTDDLVVSGVVLNEWCGNDKSLRSNLSSTLRADHTKKASKTNVCSSKGLYAVYSVNAY